MKRMVIIYTSSKKEEVDYKGSMIGFSSEGDSENIYPVAIVIDDEGNLKSPWIALIKYISY